MRGDEVIDYGQHISLMIKVNEKTLMDNKSGVSSEKFISIHLHK